MCSKCVFPAFFLLNWNEFSALFPRNLLSLGQCAKPGSPEWFTTRLNTASIKYVKQETWFVQNTVLQLCLQPVLRFSGKLFSMFPGCKSSVRTWFCPEYHKRDEATYVGARRSGCKSFLRSNFWTSKGNPGGCGTFTCCKHASPGAHQSRSCKTPVFTAPACFFITFAQPPASFCLASGCFTF